MAWWTLFTTTLHHAHPSFLPPRLQIKLLVCEIWKRHVVVQFVRYSSQVGCRYAPPQRLKNERRRAGWLWWTSPLPALSFFSVWLPWLPRGQRAANLSYWSEAALRFLLTTTANEQADWGSSEFTRSTLTLPELPRDHTPHPPAHQHVTPAPGRLTEHLITQKLCTEQNQCKSAQAEDVRSVFRNRLVIVDRIRLAIFRSTGLRGSD